MRKALDLFPFEQHISPSRILAAHKSCAVPALIYNQGLYDYNNMPLVRWLPLRCWTASTSCGCGKYGSVTALIPWTWSILKPLSAGAVMGLVLIVAKPYVGSAWLLPLASLGVLAYLGALCSPFGSG